MDGDAPTSRAVTQNTFKGWIQIKKKQKKQNSWTNDGTNFKAPALICGIKPFASAGLSTHFANSLNSHTHVYISSAYEPKEQDS